MFVTTSNTNEIKVHVENSCPICDEKTNTLQRKIISCSFCHYAVCKTCIEKYVLTLDTNVPNCMNCKRNWDNTFFMMHMTRTFLNGLWKKHTEDVLLQKEKAWLPATQRVIEHRNEIKKNDLYYKQLVETRTLIQQEIQVARQRGIDLLHHSNNISSLKNKVLQGCPKVECRGFINHEWKCGVCETSVCSTCHETKDVNHTCLVDNVKTATLLNSDTKPCPSCASFIHRINGCDQMFCVQCHCAFHWKTGETLKGEIHNPHYFQWAEEHINNHNNQGQNCEVLPLWFPELHGRFISEEEATKWRHVYDKLPSIERSIDRYFPETSHLNVEEELRISYLQNTLSEEEWKRKLGQLDKKRQKLTASREIMSLFLIVATDIFQRLRVHLVAHRKESTTPLFEELNSFRLSINEMLRDVTNQYNSHAHHIINDAYELIASSGFGRK